MSDYYIVDLDGTVLNVEMLEWAKWYETANRVLTVDKQGDVRVSTVFLGLDHRFGDDGPPILWETMIFGGEHDQYQERYTSREDALAGHERARWLAFSIVGEEA